MKTRDSNELMQAIAQDLYPQLSDRDPVEAKEYTIGLYQCLVDDNWDNFECSDYSDIDALVKKLDEWNQDSLDQFWELLEEYIIFIHNLLSILLENYKLNIMQAKREIRLHLEGKQALTNIQYDNETKALLNELVTHKQRTDLGYIFALNAPRLTAVLILNASLSFNFKDSFTVVRQLTANEVLDINDNFKELRNNSGVYKEILNQEIAKSAIPTKQIMPNARKTNFLNMTGNTAINQTNIRNTMWITPPEQLVRSSNPTVMLTHLADLALVSIMAALLIFSGVNFLKRWCRKPQQNQDNNDSATKPLIARNRKSS